MTRSHVPKRWHVLPGDPGAEERLISELALSPIVARLLVQRGVTSLEEADRFLHPSLAQLHDPMLLPDAEAACERLKQALHRKEKILVHGDYDGDGITATALWQRVLHRLGGDVEAFVPHRHRDGYDMRRWFVEEARAKGAGLIVTTDCGIQRIEEVELAREAGIDVIVTDHHIPSSCGRLPRAVAVVNPHRRDSRYPFADLAGVGVAFKLCEALVQYLGYGVEHYRRAHMDLAAIGTVTDVMPLVDENRVLVKFGLDRLQQTRKPGLRALLRRALYAGKAPSARDIAFSLGPRLNAASRVDEATTALELLLTPDPEEAELLAERLEENNRHCRDLTEQVLREARTQATEWIAQEARCLVLAGEGWPGGVIGLVAGRIMGQYARPCVVITVDPSTGVGRGSARSPHGFDVLQAIDACSDLLIEYGGHELAAGLALESEQIDAFRERMMRLAAEKLDPEDLVPTLEVAAELEPDSICPELVWQMQALQPFGSGNHEPLFVSRNMRVLQVRAIGQEGRHLKLTLQAPGAKPHELVDAVWWNRADLATVLAPGTTLDLCYRLMLDDYGGQCRVQLLLEDLSWPEW
ncbi:MAG: single-stranded-DNA-specific exonuclease RecJ [Chloroherpetonaceae bacterium]|nr:single-stranded-DNA-specific exonuclease RecJ [Chthonomonadaceae bacterium]MDW8209357.1 single-stranded-DNA-specific exonuclease RecJ [Chloroherpetonaceae bacterium]